MLVAQAHTLDAIFNNPAERATLNMGEYPQATELYFKLALKAQTQCRTTWDSNSSIKNPRTASYIRQQNIANGPQQINNVEGRQIENGPENEQSKLLDQVDGERLDFGAAVTPEPVNSELEASGAVNGAQDARRQSSHGPE
jgi:hypothetical protein